MIKKNIFTYWGGKTSIVDWVIHHFPPDHQDLVYIEPFCGSAVVLLNKDESRHEIISDLDKNLFYVYRAIRERPDDLKQLMDETAFSVNELNYAVDVINGEQKPHSDDWIHIARAKLVTMMQGVMGRPVKGAVSCSVQELQTRNSRTRTFRWRYSGIGDVTDRLKHVVVLNKDALKMIEHYDSPKSFFYLDPPYPKTSQVGYDHCYSMDDFNKLTDVLKTIKGKYLVSFEKKEGMTCFDYEKAKGRYFYKRKTMRNSKTGINSPTGKFVYEYLMCNYKKDFHKQLSFFE